MRVEDPLHTGGPGEDPDRTVLIRLLMACIAVGAVFLIFPSLDLWASGLFATADGFPLKRHGVAVFFNDLIEWMALGLFLSGLSGVIYTSLVRGRKWLGQGPRQFWFLLVSLIMAPGIVANLIFKENWGRARPRDVTQFGGDMTFSPPLIMTDQCDSNCSFVSGDASMGFTMLAVALLAPVAGRRTWLILAAAFGAFIGGVRLVQGAHFLSDVIYAGLFVALTIWLMKMIIIDGRWGIAEGVHGFIRARTAPLAPRMGLSHDEGSHVWRADNLGMFAQTPWHQQAWLLLASQPRDLGLEDEGATPPTQNGPDDPSSGP